VILDHQPSALEIGSTCRRPPPGGRPNPLCGDRVSPCLSVHGGISCGTFASVRSGLRHPKASAAKWTEGLRKPGAVRAAFKAFQRLLNPRTAAPADPAVSGSWWSSRALRDVSRFARQVRRDGWHTRSPPSRTRATIATTSDRDTIPIDRVRPLPEMTRRPT